jgi:hypothetical protein
VTVDDLITTVKHAYTHFRITLHAFHCTYKEGTPEPRACQGWKWVHPEELTQYAFPKANKTVLEKVLSEWRQQQTPPPDVSSPERAGEPPDEDVGAQQFDSPAEYI